VKAPPFGLAQWKAVSALRDAKLPSQAWMLQQVKHPKLTLALTLDLMGDEALDAPAAAALDALRAAVEAHLAAVRVAPVEELRATCYAAPRVA